MKRNLMFLIVIAMAMATLFVSCTEEPPAPELFTVTFDSDGGSSVAAQQVERGKCAQQPTSPVKEGYEFVNWNLDGKVYDFAMPITKSITLKAVWKAEAKPEPMQPVAPVVEKPVTPRKMYHLVIASFPTEAQADEFMGTVDRQQYRQMGKVTRKGKCRVYAARFDNRAEAERQLALLRQNNRYKDAWLFISK